MRLVCNHDTHLVQNYALFLSPIDSLQNDFSYIVILKHLNLNDNKNSGSNIVHVITVK